MRSERFGAGRGLSPGLSAYLPRAPRVPGFTCPRPGRRNPAVRYVMPTSLEMALRPPLRARPQARRGFAEGVRQPADDIPATPDPAPSHVRTYDAAQTGTTHR